MKFVDEAKIFVESGKGGPGHVSFRREKFIPRGGPDGGNGGRGGHVVFRASQHLNSLLGLKFNKNYKAEDGERGHDCNCSGKDGQDMYIDLPLGTLIRSKETGETVELNTHGEEYIILKGGRGGKGNTFFKNDVNQAPTYAQPGEPGYKEELHLELKLIADVGIIGFPNAGKSTLITKISAARPKVADYPFTTLAPNLGVVQVAENTTFVVADIPGLIPGAHLGAGLGIKFLKHIEKTKCFVHLVDISMMNEKDPVESLELINHELKAYDELKGLERPLGARKQLVVLNKADLVEREEVQKIKAKFNKMGYSVLTISGLTGYGIKELIFEIKRMIDAETASENEKVQNVDLNETIEINRNLKNSNRDFSHNVIL